MKKIILSIAILASGVSTFAATTNVTTARSICSMVEEVFTEIAVETLPEAVTKAVAKDFTNATISKAFVNASGQYKLELTTDDATNTVYADKDGNWLEESAVK